ncbi:multidrug efflux SMR transporter [Pantoea sp. BAV 3049]|uniref:DMT family transporter n=1 Tax=Pantoea sp. BAV 3049 TaxID=2654188 RepID=UPI00131D326A|nr:SMR family transporter [Pantoea sp. BAV 3049]
MANDRYSWFLVFAVITEITGTTLLGLSSGMTNLLPAVGALTAYICSYYLLTRSLKKIPIGLAYALWSGAGIVATSLINRFLFGAALSLAGVCGMVLIISGVLVINLLAKSEEDIPSAQENKS